MECREEMLPPAGVRLVWRLSLSTLLAIVGCAKPLADAPLSAFAVAAPQAAPFVGCWLLAMDHPLHELGLDERLAVRLDTVVIGQSGADVGLRAIPLGGFDGRQAPSEPRLVWWVHPGTDTLELATQSLSGASWRLAASGDSLLGETRLFFDLGPTESVVGAAWGRRTACDA
jgi:hypothetical protein